MKKLVFTIVTFQVYILTTKIFYGSVVPTSCIIVSNILFTWGFIVYKNIERRGKKRTLAMRKDWLESHAE